METASRGAFRGSDSPEVSEHPPRKYRALFTMDYHESSQRADLIIFAAMLPFFQRDETNNEDRENETICSASVFPRHGGHRDLRASSRNWIKRREGGIKISDTDD